MAALLMWGTAIPYGVVTQLDGDFRTLLHLGSNFPHPDALAGAPTVEGFGNDGQFFAALATDPLLLNSSTKTYFDAPYYRAARVGLPLAAWLLAGGRQASAVYFYQVLCWFLGALLPWVLARWLEEEGHSAVWAIPAALYGGAVASMYTSTPDAAAATLVVGALWLSRTGIRGALPILAFASLVRETSIIGALAVSLFELTQKRYRAAILFATVPLMVVIVWRAWVLARFGFPLINGGQIVGQANFDLPLRWVSQKLSSPLDPAEAMALGGLGIAWIGLLTLAPVFSRCSQAAVCYAGYAIMGLFLSRHVYLVHWWNYSRVLIILPALAVIIGEQTKELWRRWLFRITSIVPAILGGPWLGKWAAGLLAGLSAILFLKNWLRGRQTY